MSASDEARTALAEYERDCGGDCGASEDYYANRLRDALRALLDEPIADAQEAASACLRTLAEKYAAFEKSGDDLQTRITFRTISALLAEEASSLARDAGSNQ